MPTLPDALVVGPQRAGSTWIHEYLAARGDVALPRGVKETFFFDRFAERGLDWYAARFERGDAVRVVEVAPTYFHAPGVAERVATDLERPRVVVTLREPAERIHSLWLHLRRYGITDLGFHEALERVPDLLESGRYARHLRRWRAAVGPERTAVLLLEDLAADPQRYEAALCRGLGLEPRQEAAPGGPVNRGALPPSERLARVGTRVADRLRAAGRYGTVNLAKRAGLKKVFYGRPGERPVPPLAPADRARVRALLAGDLEKLATLLGRDLAEWGP